MSLMQKIKLVRWLSATLTLTNSAFQRSLAAIMLGLGLLLALPWLCSALPARAAPDARYVGTTGSDVSNDCTDPAKPCATLQHAIDVAQVGDEIHVAGGVYARVGTLAVITKRLSVVGGFAPDFSRHDPAVYQTVLDAGWGGPVISITRASDVTLLNLTLTRGNGVKCPEGWGDCGGGIYAMNTDLHVGQCVITNTAPASSSITADTNLFWNGADPIVGANAIQQDPLLTTDYHLHLGSPARDAGLTIPWLAADLEGNPRPQGDGYDIGAIEGAEEPWWVCLPLVMKN